MSKRKKRRLRPEAARALVVLIVLGICVYIALATTAGNYIAEKVIAPVFQMINERGKEDAGLLTDSSPLPVTDKDNSAVSADDDKTAEPSADSELVSGEGSLALLPGMDANEDKEESAAPVSSSTTAPNSDSGSSSKNASSEELSLKEFTSYALQMGAFSSEENAQAEAKNLRERGAAGYVYHDGHYRVFASVYQNEEDAQTVRKQLKESEGMESSIFVIQAPGANMRVTANEDGLASVKEAFTALETARDELYTLCTDLDRKETTEAKAREKLKSLAEHARNPSDALDGTGEVGTALQNELRETADELEKVAGMEESGIAFSTEMKYALVRQSCAYADLMKKITGAA